MGYVPDSDTGAKAPLTAAPAPAAMEPFAEMANPGLWSTGLFDCCAAPGGGAVGCVSICLPFVQYGILTEQLTEDTGCTAGSFWRGATAFLALDALAAAGQCLLCPGISLFPTSALMHLRTRKLMRQKYGIEGSCMRDLCTVWWCGPCALAQETREMVIRAALERSVARAAGAPYAAGPYPLGNLLLPTPPPTYAEASALPAVTGVPVAGVPAVAHVAQSAAARAEEKEKALAQ